MRGNEQMQPLYIQTTVSQYDIAFLVEKQITDLMEPSFILPFANFNSLYLPEHQKYLKSQPKNTPHDVVELFNNDNVTVLELLPGETWDGKNNNKTFG